MDETKRQALAYQYESITTTTFDGPPESSTASSPTEPVALPTEPTLGTHMSRLLQFVWNVRHVSPAELSALLKRTSRFWLTTGGMIFGVIALVTLISGVVERARNACARRHELAVATVTPDTAVARCGQATVDVTKQVFPILMRTISYQAAGGRTVVLTFSRTAEEKSDWVFLSLNDENGSASYDTPDAKIAVLPCLDLPR